MLTLNLRLLLRTLLAGLIFSGIAIISLVPLKARAQTPRNDLWNRPFNISRSPDNTSTDPFLVADPAGKAHLFWVEKVTDAAGNQPDTIMYTVWNGEFWTAPVETFPNPPDLLPSVHFPEAVLDDEGWLHLIWLNENATASTLFYSRVYSEQASNPTAWDAPKEITSDATGTNYAIAIAYSPPATIHILYARGKPVYGSTDQRAVTYTKSDDAGLTWSRPVDIQTVPNLAHGASNTRLLVENPDMVYASWSEWNDEGNGQAIHFTRSLDIGATWDKPQKITELRPGEYERDWNNLGLLGDGQLVAMWEGGFRAYRHAMYSNDSGVTWSEPIDTFPWLIGENGFVKFAQDSKDRVHLFLAQRVREGNEDRDVGGVGLWHSIWEGGTNWTDPVLAGGVNDMVNPAAVIVNGKRVVAAWYSSSGLEIMVMTGELQDADLIPPEPWPARASAGSATLEPQTELSTPVGISPTPPPPLIDVSPPGEQSNPGTIILLSAVPAVFIVTAFLIWQNQRRK